MIMRFTWLSWKPPEISPEAELQLAQALAAHGRGRFVSAFLGFRESRFFEVHGTGLVYLGAAIVFASFEPRAAAILGIGFVIYYLSFPVALVRYVVWLNGIERKYSLRRSATSQNSGAAPDDNAFYEAVAGEIDQARIDKVLWTRAVANSAGDEKLAKSLYIRYRVQTLQEAHTQQARADHEAQVLEQERQKVRERQAAEEVARKQTGKNLKHWGIALLIIFGILFSWNDNGSNGGGQSKSNSQATSQPVPYRPSNGGQQLAVNQTFADLDAENRASAARRASLTPAPSFAERQAALNRTLTDLHAEYRALEARRVSLAPNDPEQLAAYYRDAADYARRVQQSSDAKARLEQ